MQCGGGDRFGGIGQAGMVVVYEYMMDSILQCRIYSGKNIIIYIVDVVCGVVAF